MVFGLVQLLELGEGADQLAVQGDRLAAVALLDVVQGLQQVTACLFFVVEVAIEHPEHAQAARGLGLVAYLARYRQRFGMHGDSVRETPGAAVEIADGIHLAGFHRGVAERMEQATCLLEQCPGLLEIPPFAFQYPAFVQPQRAPAWVRAGLDHGLHFRQDRFGIV